MPYSKKYIILCIIILLMTALDVCLIYKIKVEKMDYNNTIRDVTTRNILSNLYKINVDVNLINNGIVLDSLLLMKNVSNKEEQKIIDVFQGTNKLFICRFSELNCQECTIYSILKTISHSDSIGKNNIVFWGDYENSKNLSVVKERLGIGDMNVYNLPYINIPAERIGTPYYFVIDTTLTMSDFFIPDRSFPGLTDHYFEIIKKKYFMQSITN